MKNVLVGISGGVDSAVCAALLKEQGYNVTGAYLGLWQDGKSADNSALEVSKRLGIELVELDCAKSFKSLVVDYFTNEYTLGRTPNPCVRCNRVVKLRALLDAANRLGADYIATGHYAKTEKTEGGTVLKKALHPQKDQSYFLYDIGNDILEKLLLPLGSYTKDEIREMARVRELGVEKKPDSQEICFLPDGEYAAFIKKHAKNLPPRGNILLDGQVCGRHDGIYNFTIGQRKGLGAFGRPVFVREIDAHTNTVTIGDDLRRSVLFTENFTFTGDTEREFPFNATVKIRSRAREAAASVYRDGNGIRVEFEEPQRAVTPGQSAVLYSGDTVVGGGIIKY